jgi:DNA-cytosine methyltransferase
MNVLSLFDGMGCLGIAFKDMGYKFTYYTSEIDRHAMAQSKLNFPDSVQLGDITKWREWDIEWAKIDFIGAGSPCQGFSLAGKHLAFNDPRSMLFFTFVEILNYCKLHNPKVLFLLENVKMKREHEIVISKYMNVAPIEINAALVSAQNRRRNFWTNIKNEPYGLFGDMQCTISQPKDRGILLKDILETDVPSKYYLSDKAIANINKYGAANHLNNKKSQCLLASYYNMGGRDQQYVITHNLQPRTGKGQGGKGHLIKTDQKAYCLDTANGQAIELIGCIKFGRTDEAKEIRKQNMAKGKDYTPFQAKKINSLDFDKINTLTTAVNKDNLVMQLNPSKESGGKQPYQQNRVYDCNGKNPALCSGQEQWGGNAVLVNDFKIRRLTPTECARLQSIPEWYKWNCSDTQAYKMLGNGWNIEVIKHIIKHI